MLRSETKEIEGSVYHVRVLGATEGRKMLVRLMRVLGPALGEFLVNRKGETLSDSDVLPAIAILGQRLTEEDLEYVVAKFAEATEIEKEGRRVILSKIQELHFAGNYVAMFKWIWFCLQTNFSAAF